MDKQLRSEKRRQYGRNKNLKNPRAKRTAAQRELDLGTLANLYCQGMTLQAMARKITEGRSYTLSHTQIIYDLNVVRERWQTEHSKDYNLAKATHLAKIDFMERHAWEGYFRSMEKASETTTEQSVVKEEDGTQKATGGKVRKKEVSRDGSTQWMNQIQWCLQERAKILGLYAATNIKAEISGSGEALMVAAVRSPVNVSAAHSVLRDYYQNNPVQDAVVTVPSMEVTNVG